MKKKTVVLVGIGVCLMLVTLLTSPVLASAGYSKIYGNANEDDVLDMRDVTYIKLVIFGKKPATDFADANYDGKISMLDIGQTKLIILGKEKQLTLVDQADRTVTVPRPIERVVSMVDGVRTLIQLGAADKLVGIRSVLVQLGDDFLCVRAYPKLKELHGVGEFGDPNKEEILSLKPDVMFYRAWIPEVANGIQESTCIPVVTIKAVGSLDFEMHRLVGKVMGKEEEAEDLILYANEKLNEITEVTASIPNSEKPKVHLAFWGSITRTPLFYDSVDLAGGINVAKGAFGESGVSGLAVDVSKEQIVAWNPDIILIHSGSKTHKPSIEDVLSDPDLQTINAVKNKRVYYTKGFCRGWDPATGLTEVLYMAKLFHPDKFEDLDMEKEGNEILKRFYGVDGFYTEMAELADLHRWE